jgi:hypothetical protein
MVNQNVQETLKKFQQNKNIDFEKAKDEIKETREALYKHQSETKNTINKEINECRQKKTTLKRKRPRIWKTTEKRMKQNCKTKRKAIPAKYNKQKIESQNSKMNGN